METKELENLEEIATFAKTKKSKVLVESAKSVVMSSIEELANNYKEKSRDELVSVCAKLQANLSLYQLITGIDTQIVAIKEVLEQKE